MTARKHLSDNNYGIRRVFPKAEDSDAWKTREEVGSEFENRMVLCRGLASDPRHDKEQVGDRHGGVVDYEGKARHEVSPAKKDVEILEGL